MSRNLFRIISWSGIAVMIVFGMMIKNPYESTFKIIGMILMLIGLIGLVYCLVKKKA